MRVPDGMALMSAARAGAPPPQLRFAFAGRVSTEDLQAPEDSREWQIQRALDLVSGHGEIVTEYFDIGQSRAISWLRRPESSRLLEALADPDRGFDAVVVGEPQRIFYDTQFSMIWPLFQHYKVGLWVPELGGPIDPDNDAHGLVMQVYAQLAKAERHRIQVRVFEAMRAQAHNEGRFLGGRPPYGYLFADAGPHHNPELARMGARMHRLEIDPVAGPVVTSIFEQRAAGHSARHIGKELDSHAIPCPSARDQARNRHRTGRSWTAGAVLAILDNPRYLGYQVWGKQHRFDDLIDVDQIALGTRSKFEWVPVRKWVWSDQPAQPALVDAALWRRAHEVPAQRTPKDPERAYALSGLLRCAHCGKRMTSAWNHGKPTYRCSHVDLDGAHPHQPGENSRPRTVSVQENLVLEHLPALMIRLSLTPDSNDNPVNPVDEIRRRGLLVDYEHVRKTIGIRVDDKHVAVLLA
jgi:site-specific DNA recombinase